MRVLILAVLTRGSGSERINQLAEKRRNSLCQTDFGLSMMRLSKWGMAALSEAVEYVRTNFPGWNLGSDIVYRLMMAVRRKLK